MIDSSRVANRNSSFPLHDQTFSPSYLRKEVLTHRSLQKHNNEFDDIGSCTSDESTSTFSYNHPWRALKARGGRGDLIAQGHATCSLREIELALALMSAAWLTGKWDMQWAFWPERDEISFGQCIIQCWDAVQQQQVSDGLESHDLEPHVARKVCTLFTSPFVICLYYLDARLYWR
jgi:hypothetical protein